MTFARGLRGAGQKKTSSKGPRKGPALLALAGLGAAGAAAFKRRRASEEQGPGQVPPSEPVGEPTPMTEETPPPASA